MSDDAVSRHAFIPYPTNRVVGTIADAAQARAAIDSLHDGGFTTEHIDVLHGPDALQRLDPAGTAHGFLAKFQRTLINTLAPAGESKHLRQHLDDVLAGRYVIMVLAKEHDRRDRAAGILSQHGAEYIGFYGRWHWESLEQRSGSSQQEIRRTVSTEQRNMELMQTLDDAWNAQDWDTFDARHANDVVVRWPARPPTHGRHDHRAEGVQMFKTFPDNHVGNRPYKAFFASGDWTCSIATFSGTMRGPMPSAGGKEIAPTGKSFTVDFCTVARWRDGMIVEENLFYDVIGMMQQIGVK